MNQPLPEATEQDFAFFNGVYQMGIPKLVNWHGKIAVVVSKDTQFICSNCVVTNATHRAETFPGRSMFEHLRRQVGSVHTFKKRSAEEGAVLFPAVKQHLQAVEDANREANGSGGKDSPISIDSSSDNSSNDESVSFNWWLSVHADVHCV